MCNMNPANKFLEYSFSVLLILIISLTAVIGYQLINSSQPTPSEPSIAQTPEEDGKVLGSFLAGTTILMKNNLEKNIEQVKEGDVVLTRLSDNSPILVEAEVNKVSKRPVDEYLVINGQLKVTEAHVFFANGNWISARDLTTGDYLINTDNRKVSIKTIEKIENGVSVYNFEVEGYHTYFANGFYVHNFKGFWEFYLKDSVTNKIITDATVTMQTRSPYYSNCDSGNGSWKFKYSSSTTRYGLQCFLNSGQSHPSTASVSISKSGYTSKTVTINRDSYTTVKLSKPAPADIQAPSTPSSLKTTKVERTSISLSWATSTDNIGVSGYRIYRNGVWTYTTSSTSFTDSSVKPGTKYKYYVQAYDAASNVSGSSNTISVNTTEKISDIKLPSVFSAKGSKSTNLTKIKDPKKVKNFTVDVVGKSKITFNDILNLSSSKVPSLFKSLDKYIKMNKLGVVEVDTKTLTMLAKKKATVSMSNLPFIETPDILVNGKPDTASITSKVNYEKGTLSFDVTSFSKFEAVPKLEITEPQDGFNVEDPNITLRGKVSDPEASVSAKLNGQMLGNLKVASESGQFSKQLTLPEGNNSIVVEAVSKFGPLLVATASGVFTPKQDILSINQIIGIGLVIIILLLASGGAWWYYKKRKTSPASSSPQ